MAALPSVASAVLIRQQDWIARKWRQKRGLMQQGELLNGKGIKSFSSSLAHLLEFGLKRRPTAPALHDTQACLTFDDLDRRSNALCLVLQNTYGIQSGDRVAILTETSLEIVISAIAIWKAGAVYVPIDCQNAPKRTEYILQTIEPSLLISSEKYLAEAQDLAPEIPRLSYETIRSLDQAGGEPPRSPARGDDPAIIIHTSGSTGLPKGAVLSHHSVIHYFHNHNEFLRFDEDSQGLNNGPFHFDVSIQDTFLPLYFGATVRFHEHLFVSSIMINLIKRERITHLLTVSSVLELISKDSIKLEQLRDSSLRVVLVGGEICDPKLINRWLTIIPNLCVLNGYGPTECNSVSVIHEITKPDFGRDALYPIGKPLRGMKVVLLDEQEQVIQSNYLTGGLALAGPQLMLGYWRNPIQTEKAFRTIHGEKYYVTGDQCYRDKEENYHFVGRRDMEIKIRGRRINLNEIRNALLGHEKVSYAAVGALRIDEELRIAAFVHVEHVDDHVFQALEQTLLTRVPSYMFPSYLCASTQLPKTSSEKVNEKQILETINDLVLREPGRKYFAIDGII
jgi:amino acid adenylation domain-containing protein